MMKSLTSPPQQMHLALPVDPTVQEELVLTKARELYRRSGFLNVRYNSFKRLMEDPVAGRCMRLSATHLLRLSD